MDSSAENFSCRLCDGSAARVFQKMLLGIHEVSYYRCASCGSLQSEPPYWLDEAYAPERLGMDTGAVQRVLNCMALTHLVMRLLGCRTTLDFGGGSGLLCRLLRDTGHDAFCWDKYTGAGFAAGFVSPTDRQYDLITSFEVVEHFPNPRQDFAALFEGKPKAVLLMTQLYYGQKEDWWYLAPEGGQHVFFYSREAMAVVAARYGYHLVMCRGFVVFMRQPPNLFQLIVLKRGITDRLIRWARVWLLFKAGRGAQHDFVAMADRNQTGAANAHPVLS